MPPITNVFTNNEHQFVLLDVHENHFNLKLKEIVMILAQSIQHNPPHLWITQCQIHNFNYASNYKCVHKQ